MAKELWEWTVGFLPEETVAAAEYLPWLLHFFLVRIDFVYAHRNNIMPRKFVKSLSCISHVMREGVFQALSRDVHDKRSIGMKKFILKTC